VFKFLKFFIKVPFFQIEFLHSDRAVLLIATNCILEQTFLLFQKVDKHLALHSQPVEILVGQNNCFDNTAFWLRDCGPLTIVYV
jgi:hypothetical protein